MAITITNPGSSADVPGVSGNIKYVIKDITFDDSYPTGGEGLSATQLGLEEVYIVLISQKSDGYVVQYDYSNEKLEIYEAGADGAALDELGNTADASGIAIRLIAYGK
jgi:hypothetical protein|tara:strand:- start:78 stop:401 length:324 start_codon:yes stop_codon:yes gene_type:complete